MNPQTYYSIRQFWPKVYQSCFFAINISFEACGLCKVMGYEIEDEDKIPPRAKSRVPGVTVGVAPSFRSAERAEKRKEFHIKLEQKQQALEAEKIEHEMRTKEEEEAAIKELRKGLFVKAHPVPSFYYEEPPPKFEP
ncbi:hypothetical protein L1987_74511 [Smallanthus sonchifolius]|uniref:Uncharacterized protein n=1 Tax=Smallanthus sonchifolius TaxID=185202 RepID=A0ACB9A3X2_9ASTR|nr:hypothetical protein L1987_74511 [Smallanthus sonchifolius]